MIEFLYRTWSLWLIVVSAFAVGIIFTVQTIEAVMGAYVAVMLWYATLIPILHARRSHDN
jgi:hypothetical protein